MKNLIRGKRGFAVLAALALATSILAFDEKVITVCNTTGLTVSDLHVTFSGTGGNVSVAPASVFAGACPVPLVPSNGAVTNTVVIDWGVPCIPPGACVTFTVRTANGPLNFVSGNWTLVGAPAGRIWPGWIWPWVPPPPPPPPPPSGFWAKKWQYKCVPWGRILRTPWMGLPGTPCWVRWVCIPPYTQYARKVRCYYVSRNGRLLETKLCRVIVPWKRVGFRPGRYRWQRTTLRPPDLNDPGNIPPIGPPKNTPPGGWEWGTNLPSMMDIRYSDDAGETERIGDDMMSSFFDVYHQIALEDLGTPVYPTFPQVLQAIGPGWKAGGQRILQLIPEFNSVLAAEPTASVGLIRVPLQNMGNALVAIGTDMQDGVVNLPSNYAQLEDALNQLIANFPALDPADQRWVRAQSLLMRMRDGVHVSFQQALLGLTTQTQQDYFLWGLQNRFAPEMHCLAYAVGPHVEFDLQIGNYGWEPSELSGVRVMVLNPSTGEVLDQSTLPISTNGKVFVPTLGYEDLPNIDVRIKFDTYLGVSQLVPTNLPGPMLVQLVNGDVNADELIDSRDVLAVQTTLGEGGPTAPSVPESDVNNDGIVDAADLSIVFSNLGMVGQSFFDIQSFVTLGDFVGPKELESLELTSPDGLFPPREVLLAQNGEYSISMPMAATMPMRLKGRTWLSKVQTLTFGPGSGTVANWSLTNGDVNNDNEVGPADFSRLSAAFGTEPGHVRFDMFSDLNGDGEVGPADFTILSQKFGQSGD